MALTTAEKQRAYREKKKAEGKRSKTVWVNDDDFKYIKEMATHDKSMTEADFIDGMFTIAMLRDKIMWEEIIRAKKDGVIPDNIIVSYLEYESSRVPLSIEDYHKNIMGAEQC